MAELPQGTVTFLFTDIEGSTRLLDELGDDYPHALAEHRRVLRDAFARHGGVEVDTQGDAFFVAFAKASDALAAAAEARDALADGPIRVRTGVHTGEPTVSDEGYVGIDVHRAARIAAAGHGGQILVSQTTRDLVGDGLRDLGEHRLKDIAAPERLYQLGGGEFPPLKSLNNSNLPLPAEPLIGRKKELADLLRLLRGGARLVTVIGPGGIGKTRFALEVAAQLIEDFKDGVWWVGLAPLRDSKLVGATIASAIGAKAELEDELRSKRLLLLLDNFEQVVDAASAVAALQTACPNVLVLVTSREPLGVAGEREYPLSPLPEAPAVELLRQRAVAITPSFEAEYAELVQLCDRLDRLPLAIELAAARTRSVSVKDLLQRLDRRLPLLTSRRRDVDERQRTLRATIEWSYDLLERHEQRWFACLGVFAGSFDGAAASYVCGADLDLIDSLVAKSLLRSTPDGRFFMLETIREYAFERLQSSADYDVICRRHTERALAESRCPSEPAARVEWRAFVKRDYANFRTALERLRELGDDDEFLRLASQLADYWDPQLQLAEGRYWLERAIDMPYERMTRERARALTSLAHIRWRQGDMPAARALIDEAEAAARDVSDQSLLADALSNRGGVEYILGNLDAARSEYESAADLYRRHGPQGMVAVMEHDLGLVALTAHDLASARAHLEESLRVTRELGLEKYEAGVLATLGHLALEEGSLERADQALKNGLRLALERDVVDEGSAHDLYILAEVTALRGDVEAACVLVGAGDAACELVGMAREPPAEKARCDVLARARHEFGPDGLSAAVQRGKSLTIVEGVRHALSLD